MRQAGVLPFLVLGMAMAAAHPSRLVGQEPPVPPAGDTVTLSPAELLRLRQREALERLARPPGPDTANVVPADSLQPAGGPFVSGGRPGAPGIALDMAGDSIMERLAAELAGYEPVQYQGESALFQAGTRDLVLQGDTLRRVMVSYEGIQLTADTSIHLNRPRELLEATGNPVYTPLDGDPVTSRELRVDTRTREASALGAETTYRQGGEWTVQGDLNRIQSDLVFATHARFTSCTLDVPHYHFGANRVKIIRGSVLVAAPVKLYFGDVPVMWLPFIAQSLATGRASGLLTPRFSINDVVRSSGGYSGGSATSASTGR